VSLDVAAPESAFAAAGLAPGSADHVLMNPPFNAAHNPSPDRSRRSAHVASPATLTQWLAAAALLLKPGGVVTLIWRADGLSDVLTALARGFGEVVVLPVHGKPDAAAIRVIVRAVKDSRGSRVVLPELTLTDADNKPSVAAEAVLRDGAALSLSPN
jgi:tRNA1(Val) A37 N6-methylase TrmN6